MPTDQPNDRAHDWEPLLYPGLERIIPPRHLWVRPQEPMLEYLRWTREFPIYLKLFCELREDEMDSSSAMCAIGKRLHPTPNESGVTPNAPTAQMESRRVVRFRARRRTATGRRLPLRSFGAEQAENVFGAGIRPQRARNSERECEFGRPLTLLDDALARQWLVDRAETRQLGVCAGAVRPNTG